MTLSHMSTVAFLTRQSNSVSHPSAMCDTLSKHPPNLSLLMTLALGIEVIRLAEIDFWNVP